MLLRALWGRGEPRFNLLGPRAPTLSGRPASSLIGAMVVCVCLRHAEFVRYEGLCLCVCVPLCRCVFTWPWSVWVFVCLLVSLCGYEAEGTLLLCPLPVLFCRPPPFRSSEVSWWWARWVRLGTGQGGTLHSERPVCAHTFSAASTNSPILPRVQVGSGDSGNRMTSWGHGHGAIDGAAGQWEDSIP